VLWLLIGVGTGVVSALRRGRIADRVLMTGAVAGVSAPSYLVGLLGIFLFGFTLNMVPVSGYVPLTQSPVDWLWHLVLPWLVLAFLNAAIYTRLTRGEMLEVLNEDYIRTARAKGLSERSVVGRHALRNVLIPVATVFGLDLGGLLGGAVITEKVFSMQGLGALLLDAVGNLDLQVLVGVTLFSAFVIVAANFVVDITYGLLDPRVKAGAA
jgi:peptide/nickel transport system permease protein